jgi:hypothetical protein
VQKDKRKKFDSHMEKCIFIGYPEGYKGWKFYNPKTKKVIISERADFDERYTYKGELLRGRPQITDPKLKTLIPIVNEPAPVVPLIEVNDDDDDEEEDDIYEEEEQDRIEEQEEEQPVNNNPEPQPVPAVQNQVDDDDDDDRPIALRRPRRGVKPPGEWWKVRQPTPVIPSDSDDSDEEGAHVVVVRG